MPARNRARTVVRSKQSAYKSQPLRSGKWTYEEEVYAHRLIEDFVNGYLDDCGDGSTLRAYLAKKLRCAPMRISKKFAKRCIGKLVFMRKQRKPGTASEGPAIEQLEHQFLTSVNLAPDESFAAASTSSESGSDDGEEGSKQSSDPYSEEEDVEYVMGPTAFSRYSGPTPAPAFNPYQRHQHQHQHQHQQQQQQQQQYHHHHHQYQHLLDVSVFEINLPQMPNAYFPGNTMNSAPTVAPLPPVADFGVADPWSLVDNASLDNIDFSGSDLDDIDFGIFDVEP